jgi:hypothetical protein
MPAQAAAMRRTQPQVSRGPFAHRAHRLASSPRFLPVRPMPCRVARRTERLQVPGRVVRPVPVRVMQPKERGAPTVLAGVLLDGCPDAPRHRSRDRHLVHLRPVLRKALEPLHERRVQRSTSRGAQVLPAVPARVAGTALPVALGRRRPLEVTGWARIAPRHLQQVPPAAPVRVRRLGGRQRSRPGRGGEGRQRLKRVCSPIPRHTRTRPSPRERRQALGREELQRSRPPRTAVVAREPVGRTPPKDPSVPRRSRLPYRRRRGLGRGSRRRGHRRMAPARAAIPLHRYREAAQFDSRPIASLIAMKASAFRPESCATVSATRARTSGWHGTPGQCRARTRRQYSSCSHCHTTRIPARSRPRSNPPIPLKSDPTFTAPRLRRPRKRPAR